jgi:hypothetical protein
MSALDATMLVLAVLLPWLAGAAIVAALPGARAEPAGRAAWIAGAGWLLGAVLVTLLMRVLAVAGIPFGRLSIALPLAVIGAAAIFVVSRRAGWPSRERVNAGRDALAGRGLAPRMRVAWLGLLAWLAVRFAMLLAEVVWQPLYPWDAWIQWATKAKVWYSLRTIVPFDFAQQWFAANGARYFDASPHYPATVPLWQVWTSVMLGRWDDALMNVFWWQCAVALALVAYAALRRVGYGRLGALVGTWLVSSLPLANVHVALAGYADLPMAAYYTVAAVAALRWLERRGLDDAVLALAFVVACPLIKTPGLIWALTIVAAVVVGAWPRAGLRLVGLSAAALAAALTIVSRYSPTVLGYTVHLTFEPAWSALRDAFFMLGNWHLLWYAVLAVAVLGRREAAAPPLQPFTVLIAAGAAFLLVVFGVTNARDWVADQTTVNRAALHLAPLAALWALAVFRRTTTREAPVLASGDVATGTGEAMSVNAAVDPAARPAHA